MKDKNGREILLGDIVKISGAYHKSHNCLYYVDNAGSTDDESIILKKLNHDGTIKKTKYSTTFFPLICFMSDREKSRIADEYNRKYAKIEVISGEDYHRYIFHTHVIRLFDAKARECRDRERYSRCHFDEVNAIRYMEEAIQYETAVKRMHNTDVEVLYAHCEKQLIY